MHLPIKLNPLYFWGVLILVNVWPRRRFRNYLLVTHVMVYRTIYEAHHPSLGLGGVQTAAPSTIGIS